MDKQIYDYLIVGQGLAGTLLANELLKLNAKVFVVDNPSGQSASKVAAGIFNPITGKRFVKTWLCDEIYPTIIPFYQSLEAEFKVKFLNLNPIFRPAANIKEQNQIIEISERADAEQFVDFVKSPTEIAEATSLNFGGLITKIGGWLDTNVFLEVFKEYFLKNGIYESNIFDVEQLTITKKNLIWQNKIFKNVLFCEGYGAIENKYFNWLPFNAVKGETLSVEANATLGNHVLLNGIFVVPLNKNKFKVGATYNWEDKTNEITIEAKAELLNKAKKLINSEIKVIGQEAGIRPATIDRRPFIGMHPEFQNIGIFNGLGTKGVSLGPYFAADFANFLQNNKQLNNEVNINRFSSLYLSFKNAN
jgi:glycine/D-amino acid oxidase-like deaminating enzyme